MKAASGRKFKNLKLIKRRLKKAVARMLEFRNDMADIKICKDYLRRKEAGTLELISWEDAKKELGL